MKKLYPIKTTALLLAVFVLAAAFRASASANSGPRVWQGLDLSGALLQGDGCPIEVKREKLTLSIPDLPEVYDVSPAFWKNYRSEMRAEYTFYNPTTETICAKLAFPLGSMPDYAQSRVESLTDGERDDYRARFGAYVNGEKTETTVRYTLDRGNDVFEIEKAMAELRDLSTEDPLFRPDTPVTTYQYRFDDIRSDEGGQVEAVLEVPDGGEDRLICIRDLGFYDLFTNGERIRHIASENEQIALIVFGSPLGNGTEWAFFSADEEHVPARGSAGLVSAETATFAEFCGEAKSTYPDASDTDLFNATVAMLRAKNCYRTVDGVQTVSSALTPDLLCWYEYEIVLAPGETLTNTVRAPLYPQVNERYRPSLYEYTYLLSPAAKWAKFGDLEIAIETPFYFSKASLKGFQKTDNGYRLTAEGLPDGELTFALCSRRIALPDLRWSLFWAFGLAVLIGAPIGFIVLIRVFCRVIKDRRKKRRQTRSGVGG